MNLLLGYEKHNIMTYLTTGHRNGDWRQRHPEIEYPKVSHSCVTYEHNDQISHLTVTEVSLYPFNTKYWVSFETERFYFFYPCLWYQSFCDPREWLSLPSTPLPYKRHLWSHRPWKPFYFFWSTTAQSRLHPWDHRIHNPYIYPKQFLQQLVTLLLRSEDIYTLSHSLAKQESPHLSHSWISIKFVFMDELHVEPKQAKIF